MRTFAKVALVILAAFGALQLAGLLFLVAGGATGHVAQCTVYPVLDVASTGGGARATVENRRCGDRDQQTDVSVSTKGLASGWSQTVFSAPSAIVHTGSYAPLQLRLTWLDDTHLEIRYPRGVKNDLREGRVGDLHINYIEVEGAPPWPMPDDMHTGARLELRPARPEQRTQVPCPRRRCASPTSAARPP